MKNILLTYDYEVFFVKFGSVEKSLLEPTEAILDKMNRYSMHGTFFVDVLFLNYLCKHGQSADYKRICEQLRKMVSQGHRIELHLHPHWLDTRDGVVDFSRYRVHDFSDEEQSDMFELGLNILYEITSTENKKYHVMAYRAGGWCIQPFSKIKTNFTKYGIKVDSSVAYGMYQKTDSHYFDFRNVPEYEWYRFEDSVEVKDKAGSFIEIPISTFKTTPMKKMYKRWLAKKYNKKIVSYGDGHGMSVGNFVLFKKLFENRAMYSIDGIFDMNNMLKMVTEMSVNTVNFISHPKNLTNFSLDYLDYMGKYNWKFLSINEYYEEKIVR